MANVHYGEIGDIWKHLPLAEILSLEKPHQYWESHAGSAHYPLTPSLGRDYGAFYLMEHAADAPALSASAYWQVLEGLEQKSGRLLTYPGSPLIAMTVLQRVAARFLFCDIDNGSLLTICDSAQELEVPEGQVECIQDDGVGTLWKAASQTPDQEALKTLVHIDPYRPFEETASGLTSLDLFGALSRRGVRTVLWYGYDSTETRAFCWEQMRSVVAANQLDTTALWCGEINLLALQEPDLKINPGVTGCGILTSNLSDQANAACARLGKALAEIYQRATLPDGHSGAIDFTVIPC